MKKVLAIMAASLAMFWAQPSAAAIFTSPGDTTGAPTFNRPIEDLSALSAVGTAVHYATLSFSAGIGGDYTFLTTGSFDTFSILYQGSFSPTSPLARAMVANDDLLAPPFTTSGFVGSLVAGSPYVLVTTGFDNTSAGAFSVTIGGPGSITVIPEPSSYALLALGLLAMATRQRARRDPGRR
jgi:PEP-CTERM motif